ncbi:MAG: hypothetical protein ACK4L7_05110 [Flavobacteriales bacterium]
MLQQRAKVAGALGAFALALAGCIKPEAFPPEPRISFKSLAQYADSASFVIAFTDGDGDIGLDASDTQPPFGEGQPYYHNLFLEYDTLHQGQWHRVAFALPLHYRIPRITPTGQNKALEGEIAVALRPWPIMPGSEGDTIRISARLVDRALRESNEAASDAEVVR